jgi:hypothetical protein
VPNSAEVWQFAASLTRASAIARPGKGVHQWFDTMSAAPQLPYVESLAMACFAELPLAALLAWTAWHSLTWAAPRVD